jgi:hypothetical protein
MYSYTIVVLLRDLTDAIVPEDYKRGSTIFVPVKEKPVEGAPAKKPKKQKVVDTSNGTLLRSHQIIMLSVLLQNESQELKELKYGDLVRLLGLTCSFSNDGIAFINARGITPLTDVKGSIPRLYESIFKLGLPNSEFTQPGSVISHRYGTPLFFQVESEKDVDFSKIGRDGINSIVALVQPKVNVTEDFIIKQNNQTLDQAKLFFKNTLNVLQWNGLFQDNTQVSKICIKAPIFESMINVVFGVHDPAHWSELGPIVTKGLSYSIIGKIDNEKTAGTSYNYKAENATQVDEESYAFVLSLSVDALLCDFPTYLSYNTIKVSKEYLLDKDTKIPSTGRKYPKENQHIVFLNEQENPKAFVQGESEEIEIRVILSPEATNIDEFSDSLYTMKPEQGDELLKCLSKGQPTSSLPEDHPARGLRFSSKNPTKYFFLIYKKRILEAPPAILNKFIGPDTTSMIALPPAQDVPLALPAPTGNTDDLAPLTDNEANEIFDALPQPKKS